MPRHAFTAKQVATLLGVEPAEARALIALAFPVPRDVFNAQDLVTLKTTKQLRERQLSRTRVAEVLSRIQRGEPLRVELKPAVTPAQSQGLLDFVLAEPPRRNAESLFATAVQLEEQNPAQAVDAYTEAVAANPLHTDAHVNLGRLLHQRGRLAEAEAHYVAALVSRPADVTAMFNLAVVLEDEGRADEAIARYREAIELDPTCVDAYFNLSRLYERKGEKMAAIRHLKDYRRLTQDR